MGNGKIIQRLIFPKESIIGVIIISSLVIYGCGSAEFDTKPNPALQRGLTYLQSQSGVAWVKYLGNDAFIGFSKPPNRGELRLILTAAALKGHRAVNAPCHVFAVPWTVKKPYDKVVSYGSATASVGKLQELWINEKILR